MSSLKYNIPAKQWLRCSNPVCTELALYIATIGDAEVLACGDHLGALTLGKRIGGLQKLKEPGERDT